MESLHKKLMDVTRDEATKHVQEEDGEKCFNLFSFLQALESRLDTTLAGNGSPVGKFELNAGQIARYLWCCLATSEGEATYGSTFRGMPVLD